MTSQRPRRWVVAIGIAWGVILAAGVVWASANGARTTRDQTTVAQARPVVDEAVARVVAAATADGLAVAAIGDFEQGRDCDVTVVRGGVRYQRSVNLLVAPDTEEALLRRIADRLPASYGAAVRSTRLIADAGSFVLVVGTVVGPGQVRVIADTGDCRVAGDLAPAAVVDAPPAARAAVDGVLGRLGLVPGSTGSFAVACPEGGSVTTLVTRAPGLIADLRGGLDGLGEIVMQTPEAVGLRTDAVAIEVRRVEEQVTITATTTC